MATEQRIKSNYINHLLTEPENLRSVLAFCKKLKIKEEEFYEHYSSFESLEADIWQGFFNETIKSLGKEEEYELYPVRDKMLFFYYTLFEVLKKNRSYILFRKDAFEKPQRPPQYLKEFYSSFKTYVNELIDEGVEGGEVFKFPLKEQLKNPFLVQLIFLINFWIKDNSKDFEKTDEAIEKSVRLSFELISGGVFDAALDFGKFMVRQFS
ncbi:TetR family transcriptional regulator C-terminal domain-containing protein [Marinigracilibium pacificum]|uniref:TetR/AcrR family transcriptional regulator n=1 Tax=Marinigracilibium pacificum TaxID=2729599 RepID=A0A848J3F1_9BACT|nr:TetR family transcriptional regulator C-terminal domain-containing protein [Marinigracilibium pacificum]NMM49060.1 TetR/AcrR family transcriptional regulator [Marinigracilibium pacificum]